MSNNNLDSTEKINGLEENIRKLEKVNKDILEENDELNAKIEVIEKELKDQKSKINILDDLRNENDTMYLKVTNY